MEYFRDRQMKYLAGTVFLCYSIFLESEAFAGEVLNLGKISFLILLSSMDIRYLLPFNTKNIYF